MATSTTTRSSITRILRAVTSHLNPTLLHHASPTSFLRSHPCNHLIPNPKLFSTSIFQNPPSPSTISNPSSHFLSNPHLSTRRVHTRATTLQNPRNPRRIWRYATALAFIATGSILIYKFQEKPFEGLEGRIAASKESKELELRIRGAFPGLFREGHSVVVEGVGRAVTDECWEYYLSVTEVLAKPKLVNAAMDRNHNIIVKKLKVVDEEKLKVANEKPGVMDKEKKIFADEKLQVAEGAERDKMLDWYRNSIIKSAAKSRGNVFEFPVYPNTEVKLTKILKHGLVRFQGLLVRLPEGNSVFIKVLETLITDEIREDKSDEILEDKLADINEDKLAKSFTVKDEDMEYHISVEVLTKDD